MAIQKEMDVLKYASIRGGGQFVTLDGHYPTRVWSANNWDILLLVGFHAHPCIPTYIACMNAWVQTCSTIIVGVARKISK